MMKNSFISVVRGALLHDIGKVVQRAQDNPTEKKHTKWGDDWLQKNLTDKTAALASIAHHFTKDDDYAMNNNLGLIWYQADNLASKERRDKEKLEEGKWHSEIAIASPFSRINNPSIPTEKPPLTFLQLIQSGRIEEPTQNELPSAKEDYKRLLSAFERDFKNPDIEDRESINFLLMIIEKHFNYVPSITMKIYDGLNKEEIKDKHPDISLYDHLKLTAAIAGCMYYYYSDTHREKWNNNKLLKEEILNVPSGSKPYLLIGGDISGVQKFIYTITSKGALKSLKGRSFFLELLTEHIVSETIKALELTRCNLIFVGGGHFYILSHNTKGAVSSVAKIKDRIDNYLFMEFGGSLQINLEIEPFHPSEFADASKIWGRLAERLEAVKKTKWKDKLLDILKPQMPLSNQSCEVCFREDVKLDKLTRNSEAVSEIVYEAVCDSCRSQFGLGEELKKISAGSFPVIYRFDSEPTDYTIKIENVYYLFKEGWDRAMHKEAATVYRLNDLTAKHYSHPQSVYLAAGLYQHNDLDDLASAATVYGINRIAVLRMDVDNLGKIFSQAVPFSRMASISRGLNNFFKRYLNYIVEGKGINDPVDVADRGVSTDGRMLTIVYSGGDDLFLIGHWLDVTETAFDIARYFSRYTGNPFIKISGGIAVNHEKYPVYQYAQDADQAEKLAKKVKNSITLFGTRDFIWSDAEKLLERVRLFARFLKQADKHLATDEDKLPMTFFYRLLALARRFKDDGSLILPKAAYLISRAKTDKCNPKDILELKGVIMNNNQDEWNITEAAAM
ncbi:MAG: type III-A CRISPR-associated protein Cas10/Csm1 [Nitrospirae bacterium]|nr:type III-A CRISPR-associated protein Cas10/Csm1 [Nitrospirota bacterium]